MRFWTHKANIFTLISAGLAFGLLSPSPTLSQKSGDREIVVSGDSMIESRNVADAKTRALQEALRQAVEQGLGVFIDNQSIVENFQLTKKWWSDLNIQHKCQMLRSVSPFKRVAPFDTRPEVAKQTLHLVIRFSGKVWWLVQKELYRMEWPLHVPSSQTRRCAKEGTHA